MDLDAFLEALGGDVRFAVDQEAAQRHPIHVGR
jgi:hypothetical protein